MNAMADWNGIKKDIKKTAGEIGKELTKMGEKAVTSLKLNSMKIELSELFEELGRISYKKLRSESGDGPEQSSAEDIAVIIAKIDEKRRQIKALEEEIGNKK